MLCVSSTTFVSKQGSSFMGKVSIGDSGCRITGVGGVGVGVFICGALFVLQRVYRSKFRKSGA